jgi:SAM-dependent methyltransferase
MRQHPEPKVRLEIFATLLKSLRPGRLLDLGCGHGNFAILASEMGWQVTAVDVRTQRMPMTTGVRWIQSDVRKFEIREGEYDCIALLGLLYHLELSAQLDLLKRCAHATTILDTHVSVKSTVVESGYEGELFDEQAGRTLEQLRESGTASWGNLQSFWPEQESLIRMLHDSGYECVYQCLPPYQPDRAFYICLPPTDIDVTVAWRQPAAQTGRGAGQVIKKGLSRARRIISSRDEG